MATLIEIEISELSSFNWIQITDMGEENLYFTHENQAYFCKIG